MRDFRGLGGIGADFRNVNQEQGNEEAIGQSKGMMPSWPDGATGSSSQPSCSRYHPYARKKHPGENVLRLLALREVAPSVKRSSRRLWGDAAASSVSCSGHYREVTDAKRALISWLEAESLRHCTAKYCPLQPAPRSTIAAAFSPDGNTLASTHGDHTVKIICCRTGYCLKVLSGHRRTPWVVRFHPGSSEVLASGSLDNEVRLWDANTAECVGFQDFYRPIASLAFHAQGDLLAVASGHKLYIWQYTKEAEAASPVIVLRTRRSLRAVHFHPHAAPLLLTAEVNDLDSPDCPMTIATSTGLARGTTDSQSEIALADTPAGAANTDDDVEEGCDIVPESERDTSFDFHPSDSAPMDVSPRPSYVELSAASTSGVAVSETVESVLPSTSVVEENFVAQNVCQPLAGDPGSSSPAVVGAPWDVGEAGIASSARGAPSPFPVIPVVRRQEDAGMSGSGPVMWPVSALTNMSSQLFTGGSVVSQSLPPTGGFSGMELPFLPGLGQGQAQPVAGQRPAPSATGGLQAGLPVGTIAQGEARVPQQNPPPGTVASATLAALASVARLGGGNPQVGLGQPLGPQPAVRLTINQNQAPVRGISIPNIGDVEAAQAAMAAAELPCTVKLRIWPHDIKRPSASLDPETCRLTIPHAVLCSEMGAHFSPCGRFLAACVACVLPPSESDSHGHGSRSMNGSPGAGMSVHSPTQHPISAQQVIYELRVYSLEEATFGQVLASRAVRAAHCLTSIQFSPTSEHILLAYGRRHSSLLRSLVVMDGSQTIPIYTILEVYRVSDMELVRVLPSAEDEVNVACFHPRVGGGLVYGTKEGKLRILRHDRTPRHLNPRRVHELEDELLEQAETADPLSFGFVPDMEEAI
ncbi:unnamed protein product [Calypogeia fissa]